MKIRLVTVVWGRDFVETFLRIALRTLVAEGNAADLAQAHQVTYTIYTTPEDRLLLEADPAFARLSAAVTIQYALFSIGEIDSGDPSSHGIFWHRAIDLARRRREVLFFVMPDVAYARGTFLAWAKHFENGKRAVFTVGPRVALESALPELEERFPSRHEPWDLSREDVLDLLYRHFHPLHAIMRTGSSRLFAHPEYDLRIVPGRGVMIRELTCHPFCLDPSYFTNLRYFTPEDHLESLALEPCSAVSVEPLLKLVDQWYRPWPRDGLRMSNLGTWTNWHTSASCEWESARPFDLLLNGEVETAGSGRERAIAGGRHYRAQTFIASRLAKLFGTLQDRGFRRAAELLAAAVYVGPLRRRLGLRTRAIILVPIDAAFEADSAQISDLLKPGNEHVLLDLIADHVILDENEHSSSNRWRKLIGEATAQGGGEKPLFTARGERAEALLSMLGSTAPFVIGPFTIFPVDRILWRDRKEPAPVPASSPALAAQPANALDQQPSAPASRGIMRRTLERYRAPARALARRGLSRLANVSRRVTLALEGVPVLGRSAKLGSLVIEKTLREGPRSTLKKVAYRLAIGRLVAPLRRRSGVLMTVVNSVRRDGLSATVAKITHKAATAARSSPRVKLRPAEHEMLDDIRRVRALQAAEQVLVEFQRALQMHSRPLNSLSFTQAKLAELERASGMTVPELLGAKLVDLTRKRPAWAEAWLELGFLRQDQGRLDEALICFEQAMRGRMSNISDRARNPLATAAACRGRLLKAAGRDTDALASFSICLRQDPNHPIVPIEYADALRRAGQSDAALAYYARGMNYNPPKWRLPRMPRDARDIAFKQLTPKRTTIADATMRGPGPSAGHSAPSASVEVSS